jgi:hypothetical protein
MVAGNATHQAAVLAVMATGNAGPLTIDQLDATLPIGRKQIASAAAKLMQRDYVERLETGVYRLTLTGREALEAGVSLNSGSYGKRRRKHRFVPDSLQQRAWSAMRLSKRFAMEELFTLAVLETDKNPKAALQQYIKRLGDAGYIAELPVKRPGESPTSNGFKQWRLIRDTGPASPRYISKEKALKDWNTREVFPLTQPGGEA